MSDRDPIAIVGLACRFPGAPNVPAFWRLLSEGRCAIREVPSDRWDVEAYFAPEPATWGRMSTRHGGFVEEIDRFDPAFFGLSPREADAMDPQQRLLLELAWEAFEDSGISPPSLTRSRTGVFVGISSQDYARLQIAAGITPDAYAGTGNAACIASNRISYMLDLRGPSISVDTACSSSLTAIHLAADSIRRGESELAIAGGVNAILAPDLTITFSQARMMAADGLCKTFDARADGYVRSEGAGIIVLERLSHALANGHPVRAILAASAVSQDGRSNGLTAPNGPSQESVIEAALATAGVDGPAIDYVEAHGTGTPLGDPIELRALAATLGKNRGTKLRVGSVKTNIGHLEAAAGVAGVIKTVLALEHQAIPAHLHFQAPNPHLSWEQLPIRIPTALEPWLRSERTRRAGVSSFGFGGTNAHLVLEEAPSLPSDDAPLPVVSISARSKEALAEDAKQLAAWIEQQPDLPLADLTSACASRTGLPERIGVWGATAQEVARGLSAFAEGRPSRSVASGRRSLRRAARVAFLFPGQGSHLAGLGRGLYEAEPVFRRALDRAAAAVDKTFGRSLLETLFEADEVTLRRTELAQPILFAVGHALAETWATFGVVPDVVLGHSLGELTAATVAGALELEAAAAFVVTRGRLMQRCQGAMAAVLGDESATRAALSDGVEIAAYNGPDQLTITGPAIAVEATSQRLSAAGLSVHRLATDHPFHSAAIDVLQEELAQAAAQLGARSPRVALVSSWLGARADVLAKDHFVRQAREPVQFGAALQAVIEGGRPVQGRSKGGASMPAEGRDAVVLERGRGVQGRSAGGACMPAEGRGAALDLGPTVLIEMGPSSLLSMARRAIPVDRTLCASLGRAESDPLAFAEALGTAYARGVDIDWTRLARHPSATHLPPRSYERRRCWFDPEVKAKPPTVAKPATARTVLGQRIASPLSAELYESQLSANSLPFLSDHRVHGAMVLPATAYLEAATSARPGHTLEDVRFEGALLVSDGETRSIQTIVEPDSAGGTRFTVCSQTADGNWVRHSSGRTVIASGDSPARVELGAIAARLPEPVEPAAHYERLTARGLEYGPSFRGVTSLRRRDGEALGEVRAPLEVDSLPRGQLGVGVRSHAGELDAKALSDRVEFDGVATGEFRLHPAVLDACLQVVAAALPTATWARDSHTFLPVRIERYRAFAAPTDVLMSHAVLRGDIAADADAFESDVRITDAEGRVIAELQGFRMMRLERARTDQSLHHRLVWKAMVEASQERALGTWVVLGAEHAPFGCAVRAELAARGATVREDFDLAPVCAANSASEPDSAPQAGSAISVLDLTDLDRDGAIKSGAAAHAEAAAKRACALAGRLAASSVRLFAVTRDVERSAASAAIWGALRAFALEHPDRFGALVDVDDSVDAEALVRALATAGRESELRLRGAERLVPRVEPIRNSTCMSTRLRADATYLISGGLGALGLQVAERFVREGARAVVLIARRGENDAQRTRLKAMRALGAQVRVAIADVADPEALAAALADLTDLPPIRGVVHAAGVAITQPMTQVSNEELTRTFAGKVHGAWNLEHAVGHLPLDFFVLFSSISAVWGSRDLAAYAAANHALHALVAERRRAGRPALSLAFGPWDGGGMAAGRAEELRRVGLNPLSPSRALDAMFEAMASADPHRVIADADWAKLAGLLGRPALFGFVPTSAASSLDLAELATLDLDARRDALTHELRSRFARVLRSEPELVPLDEPLTRLGIDSLMAVELRNGVEADLGVSIPLVKLLGGPTVRELAAVLEEGIRSVDPESQHRSPRPVRVTEPDRTDFELSLGQRALWFVQRLDPSSSAYNISGAVRVTSTLDVAALGRVFQRLVDRHAALRTTLPAPGGQPIQRVHATMRADFEALELQGDLQSALAEEANRPFELEQGPLFRGRVLREPSGTHVLLVSVHHTVADFWSLVVLIDEVGKLYGPEVRGEAASLPALPLEYTDWARWQSERISGPHGDALWAYWREQLGGELPVLDLPTDRPRPAVQRFHGASTTLELDKRLAAGLRAIGERHGATLYMTLLAAFSALLARYGGQDEALVGSPVAGRDHSDLTGLVGYFVNPVVIRSRLCDDPSFEVLLERTRDAALGAFQHHDLPFATLVERLRPPRTASHSPVFQAMFVLQKAQSLDDQGLTPFVLREAGHTMKLGELQVESVSLEHRVAQFDLTLTAVEKDGGISASLEYNTDLFDAATADGILASLRTLVAGIVEDPAKPVRALPLVAHNGIDPLSMGAGPVVPLTPQTVHGAVLEAVQTAHSRTALVHRDRKVTFAELAESSERVAQRLIEAGVEPGARVAVLMDRSIEMVTALLAVMRAGAAYVPVDPSYPAPRVAQILQDASASAVVTDSRRMKRASELGIPVILAGTDAEPRSAPPLPEVQPDALAYVLYTSGSTGRPKGVMVRHENVTAFFTAMDELLGAHEPRTWAAVTSIAFDISVLELLYSLASGDTVVVIDDPKAGLGAAPPRPSRPVDLSLFYFANDDGDPGEAYRLLLDGARFADEHGFAAVWTPERHFHAFGGLYPNPAVTSAALASITQRVRLRAGSVVLPLHHPVRVAEEWALVDQLSGGRVDLAIASGWQPSDFVFAPDGYETRREDTREGVEQLRRLWRGEALRFPGGAGEVEVRTHPRPVQAELPLWITCAGSPDTFRWAGEIGANVLTHLLGQSRDELRDKLAVYREARREAGHSGPGHVTLMIHTFLAEDTDSVRETVRAPLERYLRSSADLMRSLAGPVETTEVPDSIVARAFDRYFESSGLFGSADTALPFALDVAALGVNELACLVDFGVPADQVRASFEQLAILRERLANSGEEADWSLAAQIDRHGVTHLQCTPSLMSMLLEDARTARALGDVSQILLGGEALPATLAERVTSACPRARVFNMYGPTETTVWSTAAEVVAGEPITIGRPLTNTTAYVLDAGLSPVPIGVPGELYLAGAGVSAGYLGQPELSRARFVDAPHSVGSNTKMYRTGDLVRWRADGRPALEFLGRADQQIKLRGARIEIGEIEHALESHPSVLRAGVSLRKDDGHPRLVAHVVGREGVELELAALRSHVKAILPEVMVPASILEVEALPQTPNGKLDRNALARLDVGDAPSRAYVAPRNDIEQRIADIWAEVLPTKRIGIHDNFFELGGDSILSIRIITRAREQGMSVAPAMLFRHQTIAELAEVVRVVEPTPAAPAPAAALSGLDRAGVTKLLARVQRAKLRRAANDSGRAERTGEDS